MLRLAFFLSLLFIAPGCATTPPEKLPAYPWTDAQAALRTLCERSRRVQSVSSEAALTLTRSNGDSVRLDAAIVMRLPDAVRMRAWKFGQAVFDLTLNPNGLWIESPPDPDRRAQMLPASLSAAKMARAWTVISGEFFCAADARVNDAGGPRFQVQRNMQGQRIVCDVDRATLVPRRYRVFDASGAERFSLMLDHYSMLRDIPWPDRLTARSEGGVIAIELKNPELNGELAPNAFVPPRRAQKIE